MHGRRKVLLPTSGKEGKAVTMAAVRLSVVTKRGDRIAKGEKEERKEKEGMHCPGEICIVYFSMLFGQNSEEKEHYLQANSPVN